MSNLWQTFCATVKAAPNQIAIIDKGQPHSFAELARRVEDFRYAYIQSGVSQYDRILLWMRNSHDMAAALVACWGQDAIPVLIDASGRYPQLLHAIDLVEPRVIVCPDALPGEVLDSRIAVLHAHEVSIQANLNLPKYARALSTDPASIVFTSGSTGFPKGVVQTHHNLERGCLSIYGYMGLRSNDILLCPVPWSFDYGYGQLLSTLLCGITHVIPSGNNPFDICEALEQQRPTILAGTPSLFAYLMGGMSPLSSTDISSLRLLTNTGGKVPQQILDGMLNTFVDAQLILNYGLTETYRSCYLPPELLQNKSQAIGVPIPGVNIEVLRADGTRTEPFEEGEIIHRGQLVCMGYWRDKEATEVAIRGDPLAPSGLIVPSRAMFTGDIGYHDEEGIFYYVGRRDRLLKSMGVRVSPYEVEDILLKSGLLTTVAVFGLPHDILGHEVHAAVVVRDTNTFELCALERYARQNMTQYMLPRRYHLLDKLPQTTSGKTNISELEKMVHKLVQD
ncbi:MAG TPA: hypothetical protein DEO56_02570 [Nitrosomonas nitrosa]|nr:hypothetical protein [Nitrosomonas nitrosa]HNP52182.1 AMP-binding protein [Nitrosomonas nitrosa]